MAAAVARSRVAAAVARSRVALAPRVEPAPRVARVSLAPADAGSPGGMSGARPSLARFQTVREKLLPRASALADAPCARPA